MAPKRPEVSAPKPSKVRFVMIEAELNETNSLSDLTQAITQALKPATANSTVRVLPPAARQAAALSHGAPEEVSEDVEQVDEQTNEGVIEGEVAQTTAVKTPRPKAKLPLPTYLHDLDMTGKDVTFKAFAEKHSPSSHMRRYLVAAAWMKDHGDSPTVNINKMYTAYKTAGWPIGINDWDSNFRSLVKIDKMRRVSTGEYAINPLGESDLQSS